MLPLVLQTPSLFRVLADPRASPALLLKLFSCPCDHNTCGPLQTFQLGPCQGDVHSAPPCDNRICDLRHYHTSIESTCHLCQKSPCPADKCIGLNPLCTCALKCAFHVSLLRTTLRYLISLDRFSFTGFSVTCVKGQISV